MQEYKGVVGAWKGRREGSYKENKGTIPREYENETARQRFHHTGSDLCAGYCPKGNG